MPLVREILVNCMMKYMNISEDNAKQLMKSYEDNNEIDILVDEIMEMKERYERKRTSD